MKFKKTIGILGGMGPVASLNMYKNIIEVCHKYYNCKQDEDFPEIIIYNLPLEGFDETGFVDANLAKEQLIKAAKKLELAGSDFLIIACNTVHYFQNDIAQAINIPLLSIIDETIKEIALNNLKVVEVLGSESTIKLGVYHKPLAKEGFKIIDASKAQQNIINQIIFNVMQGKNSQKDTQAAKKIIKSFKAQGAEAIVLGCTELPLAIKQSDIDIKLFNSVEILTLASLKYASNN